MSLYSNIKKQLKIYFDNIRNEKIKTNVLQAIPFWTASVITGLIAVGYAKLFSFAENGTAYIFHNYKWSFFIVSPVCFITAWWLVKKFAPFSRGSGIPQVMAAIELSTPKNYYKVSKLLSCRIIVIKIMSSLIMALGGGVIGREGPTIQIAGSVFRKINLWLPEWWPKISKKNMIKAGAAAGLAAAFNTPLGGIVFTIEELTKTHISYYKTAIFSAVIIAGLTSQSIMGYYLYLGYPDVSHLSAYVFLIVILVSVISGLTGSLMCKIILILLRWKSAFKHNYQTALYVFTSAIVIVSIALFVNERMFGSGKELMTHVLFTNDKYTEWYMPLIRIAGPILSFTTGAAGGVFAPALSAGASIGSLMAGWFHQSPTDSNILILSGMAAFLTGVTRSPFTSAILVLEMTDSHNVVFYLMLAGMIAGLVAIIIDKHSFYDHLKHYYIKECEADNAVI